MKSLLFACFYLLIILSCENNMSEYQVNLENFKNLTREINIFFIDPGRNSPNISNYYTNDFMFHSYPAGDKKGVKTFKDKYISELKQMKKMNMSINIGHTIYLPGIDEESYILDGSVRVCYGATIS